MSIAVIHSCSICEGECLGHTGQLPEGWGKLWDERMLCENCIQRWQERFNEEPPIYDKGVKR